MLPEAHVPGGGDDVAAVCEEHLFPIVVHSPAPFAVGFVAAVPFPLYVIVTETDGWFLLVPAFAS